jgi:ribosome-binding factor A
MSQRIDRVDELLRQEIGRILAKDVQDPHVGFATVTKVETTPDLGHARVWVSVIGESAERTQALAALDRAMGYVRHELGLRLRLRRIPALHVSLDLSAERGTRVMQILHELEQGHDAAGEALADAPLAESLPTPVARVRRDGDADDDPLEPAGDAALGTTDGGVAGPGAGPGRSLPPPARGFSRRQRGAPPRPRGTRTRRRAGP